MDLNVIIFAKTDLDWNWLFSFEYLRNFRFIFGTADYCNFRFCLRTAGQHWIAANDTLGAICCRYNAASTWANHWKSRNNNQHNSNWDYTFDQVRSPIAADQVRSRIAA